MPDLVEKKLECSFCGKKKNQVTKLVAGPGVYVCNVCVSTFEKSAKPAEEGASGVLCSFCGQKAAVSMVSKKNAVICDRCIALCREIINNEFVSPADSSSKSRKSSEASNSVSETSREALINILANSALINACAMQGANIDASEVQAEFGKRLKELGMDPDKSWSHPQAPISAELYPQILLSQMNHGLRLIATRLSAIEKKLEMIDKEDKP